MPDRRSQALMMEPRTSESRYATLRDYLLVVRRYWVTITLIALIGLAAGVADALRQTVKYQAIVQLSFQDPSQQLAIVGLGSTNVESPQQLASTYATSATAPSVLEATERRLGEPLSSLQSIGISTSVDQNSGLLDVTVTSKDVSTAVRVANGIGTTLVGQANASARARFAALATNVRRQLAALTSRAAKGSAAIAANQLSFLADELARLQTIGTLTQSAQVARPATGAAEVGASKIRSAVIGLLLGILLGLAAAFVRDSLDRRLRSAADIERAYHLPILGHIRREAMGQLPQLAAADDRDAARDVEAVRILRRNVEYLDPERPPRVILVTSALPEEGKTTVAGSFALAVAAGGRRALLVDCDLRRPTLAARLGIEPTPGLTEYLRGSAGPADILRTVSFQDPSTPGTAEGEQHQLVCVPAGVPQPTAAELLGSERFSEFLRQVREVYDVVLLDSSPLLPVADTLEILPHVDAVIVCAREAQTTRDQAAATRAALKRFPPTATGVVMTGVSPNSDYAYAYGYGYTG